MHLRRRLFSFVVSTRLYRTALACATFMELIRTQFFFPTQKERILLSVAYAKKLLIRIFFRKPARAADSTKKDAHNDLIICPYNDVTNPHINKGGLILRRLKPQRNLHKCSKRY